MIEGDDFTARFGHLFEHSPWVAERAAENAPFADADSLHAALMAVVAQASEAEQLALIRAHPELAAKSVELTEASEGEQKGAGLKALSAEEFARFGRLNAAYGAKFGFPFIICVRMHDKTGIFSAFEQRLGHDAAEERARALREIGFITRLRLNDLLGVTA